MKSVISHIIGYLEGLEKVKMRIKPLATVVGGNIVLSAKKVTQLY